MTFRYSGKYSLLVIVLQLTKALGIASSLIIFSLHIPAASAEGAAKKHILLLHSYHKGLEWTDSEDKGIMAALQPRLMDIDIHTEYLDTKRIADAEHFSKFVQLLKHKYKSVAFNVIIASDDDAFNFYLAYHDTLFPGVPVVFCGVNYFREAERVGREDLITGVVEAFDVPDTLRAALKLHPKTKRIVIINDRTTTGLANRKILDAVMPEFADKIRFEFFEDLDMPDLLGKVRQLSSGDIILLMTFNRDMAGNVFDYNQSIDLIAKAALVPIYGVWDFYLGKGIVGGMLTSGTDQGRTAAEMALRILDNEKVRNIPIVKESPNRFMFDYLKLKKFGIRPADLPAGSIVVNQPDTFYSRHKNLILATSAVIGVLSLTVVILLVNISQRQRYEAALRESEGKYRDLYDNAPDMYHSINREGVIIDCNATEAAMLGYRKDEILGRPVANFLTEESRKIYEKDFTSLTEHRSLFGLEREFVRKDGSTFLASLNVFIELDDKGRLIRTKTIGRDITAQKQVEDELRVSREELRSLSAHIQSAREEERGHIAREIHDELGQILSKLKLDLAWIKKRLSQDQTQLIEKTEKMTGLVDTTIKAVQRISSELRPGVLDYLGLSAAIEWQFSEFRDQTGLTCSSEIAPDLPVQDKDIATAVFRIFQETLTNIIRHSRASKVDVTLKTEDNMLMLIVKDDGIGIPEERLDSHESFGLMGMSERARFLGGRVTISGAPGTGTNVFVSIPLKEETAA